MKLSHRSFSRLSGLLYSSLLVMGMVSLPVAAAERESVTTIRPLMLRALAQGSAQGVLVGSGAQTLSQTYKTMAPILVDVLRIKQFVDPGCGRLQVTTRQAAVTNRDSKGTFQDTPHAESLVYTLNFCRDGSMPDEDPGVSKDKQR